MERIIDLNEYHTREQATREQASLAGTFLLIKPLTAQHIKTIETTFKNHGDLSYWCGYTFIKNIPPILENEIMPIGTSERMGAVLFLNTSESLHLLFQDVRNRFHLMTEAGQTISIKKTLEEILSILRRRKN